MKEIAATVLPLEMLLVRWGRRRSVQPKAAGVRQTPFYYSSATEVLCDQCDNFVGTPIDVGGTDPDNYFYDASNAPFALVWDFVNTWQARTTDYPRLQ